MEQFKEPYVSTTEPQPQSPPPVYEKPSLWARLLEFINTFWVYEIVASVISLAMMAGIFGVLKHYNNWDVNLWSHSWSLNSLVGLLATISQIAMAVPLASGISQLKWVWYKESQKLTDLDKFDQSSRGPMGSVGLLLSRPFKFLGAFGAILTILTLAFHTLIQNAISTKSGLYELDFEYLVSIERAAIYPQGNAYNLSLDYSSGNTLGDQGPVLDMVADIDYGMFFSTAAFDNQQVQLTGAYCATGNCTWDYITSLGVCSKCADISSYIDESENDYSLYGMSLDRSIGLISSMGDTKYPDNTVLQDIGPLLVHWAAMFRGTVEDTPLGIDCALYWCVVEQSNVTMVNYNVTNEIVTSWSDYSDSAQTSYMQTTDVILDPPTCVDERGREVADITQCRKTVTPNAQLALQNFFTSPVLGFTGSAVKNLPTNGWNISSEFIQVLYTTISASSDVMYSYKQIMQNIGFMITSNIRQSVATPQGDFPGTFGETDQWTTLYDIRWGFLAVPTILVVGSIVFLLVAIFKSWGQEKWKASLLPLLFHPLGERPGVAPHKLSEIKVVAENKEVRLERSHLGSQFV